MANTAQLFRRQSSRDLLNSYQRQRSVDNLELKVFDPFDHIEIYKMGGIKLKLCVMQELRGRLIRHDHNQSMHYGATNPAFIEDAELEREPELFPNIPKVLPIGDPEIIESKQPEDERESWDSKLTFLLATIG